MTRGDIDLSVPPELDRRLRRALTMVAETVHDAPFASAAPVPAGQPLVAPQPAQTHTRNRKRRRRIALALALAAVPLAAFGYAYSQVTVDQIPPKNAFIAGAEAGERYWLVPSFHQDACDRKFDGVELVEDSLNKVGHEWSTVGIAYGDVKQVGGQGSGCREVDETAWLRDPTRTGMSYTHLGGGLSGSWIVVLAVHPSVTSVRINSSDRAPRIVLTTPTPTQQDGPRYAVFTTPNPSELQLTMLTADGAAVPGGSRTITLPSASGNTKSASPTPTPTKT
jgi:hypothetical protein